MHPHVYQRELYISEIEHVSQRRRLRRLKLAKVRMTLAVSSSAGSALQIWATQQSGAKILSPRRDCWMTTLAQTTHSLGRRTSF